MLNKPQHLKTPLLVVLGHTNCGAVTTVVTNAKVAGNIPPILANIIPAVLTATRENPDLKGTDLIPAATQANVFYSMEQLFKRSETIRDKTLFGKLKVIGALYDIKLGQVEWLGPHPRQESLLSNKGTKESSPKQSLPTRRAVPAKTDLGEEELHRDAARDNLGYRSPRPRVTLLRFQPAQPS